MAVEIIAPQFVIRDSPMICASAEAEARKYKCYADRNTPGRLWLVSTCRDPASHIYVGFPYDTRSQGFAGRWLTFEVVAGLHSGETIRLQGPWASNTDSLYEATGVDLRDQHLTFVVIALSRRFEHGRDILENIVYQDDKPRQGSFHRDRDIAARIMAENPNLTVVYTFSKSRGGSSHGPYLRDRDYAKVISHG